jgi:Calcineurin-like phosphoesterase
MHLPLRLKIVFPYFDHLPGASPVLTSARTLLLALALGGCAARIVPPTGEVPAAGADAVATVFLIGDAGEPHRAGEPVLQALERALAVRADSSLILFLGDNLYPRGLPDSTDPAFPEAARRLQAQVDLARLVPTIFVPGNHDWDASGREGLARIRRQGRFVARESGGRARLLPADGCPGPVVADVGPGLRLLLLDTEWWLFPHEKPGEGSNCATRSPGEVVSRLREALEEGSGRQVLVAGHHPLLSGGIHGGYFSLLDHIFPLRNVHPALLLPLPYIGSLYPVARGLGISPEDLNGGPYRLLRASLDSAFACRPPALYVAGHEHGLQLLDRGRPPLLAVSGAGIYGHESHLQRIAETRLALAKGGFMRADLLRDGRLRLAVIEVSRAGEPREVYATLLPAAGPAGGEAPACATGGGTR